MEKRKHEEDASNQTLHMFNFKVLQKRRRKHKLLYFNFAVLISY
jgi:hypothetical protein